MTDKRTNSLAIRALFLSLLVWPTVWLGLYHFGSAPLAFVFYHVLCLGGGWLLHRPSDSTSEPPGPHWRRIVFGAALLANVGAAAAYLLLGNFLLNRAQTLLIMNERGLPPSAYLWLFPYFAIVNPLAEEWFWRRGVYRAFRDSFGVKYPRFALLSASLLFGAWHWLTARLFVAPLLAVGSTLLIAVVGFSLTIVYERTNRLVYPVLLHALSGDVPLLVLLLLMNRT